MSKIKAPKMKEKAVKVADSVEDSEKPLTENDTQEIHDFIKGLGLDQFGPEGMPEESSSSAPSEKPFKAKKSAALKPMKDFLKPVDRAAPKSQTIKVAEPKSKKFQAKQSEDSASGLKIDLSKPPQNKKIVFDKSQTKDFKNKKHGDEAETRGAKIDLSKPSQNKKIVFDETFTTESLRSKKQGDQSTGLSISTGPPQNKKIVFDESYIVGDQPLPDTGKDEAWYNLLISPDKPWFQQGKKLKSDGSEPSPEEVSKCEAEGKRYLDEDTANFLKVRAVGSDKSENRWMQTVLKSGAFTDKIAAHTILLQESAAHNLQSLKFLISLLDVKGRRECLASLDALLRLFTEGRILNPDAKLNLMNRHPIKALSTLTVRERKETLALWSFEHQLKDLYNQFIQALDGLLKDSVETTRRKTIAVIATLLAHCPEQEQSLLNRLVNKVGDPTRGVATTAVAQMEKILEKHSNMKTVIVAEVERLLYRPNIDTKAQYYALCFLSQILLDEEDIPLATKLVIIYVSFFKACVKKGEVDSKLMSALLTGLRRAFPYTKSQGPGGPLEAHVSTLFKMLYMEQFRLAIQVLCNVDQIAQKDPTNSDKFYSALFYKLLDPGLALSTRQSMLLNLVYCAPKRDESVTRLRTFVKRILQVCMSCPAQLACGFLFLVSELIKQRPEIKTFTAVTAVKTFVVEDDDDEEEHYKDIEDEEEEDGEQQEEQSSAASKDTKEDKAAVSTWIHRNNAKQKAQEKTGYDALVRNPLFGKAEQSGGLWEMTILAEHFHPSVVLIAKHIIEGTPITDPLQDSTLVRFLDRFLFRNSQFLTLTRKWHLFNGEYLAREANTLPPKSNHWQLTVKSLPVDLHIPVVYLEHRVPKGRKLERDEDYSDIESVASEEFEQYPTETTVRKT